MRIDKKIFLYNTPTKISSLRILQILIYFTCKYTVSAGHCSAKLEVRILIKTTMEFCRLEIFWSIYVRILRLPTPIIPISVHSTRVRTVQYTCMIQLKLVLLFFLSCCLWLFFLVEGTTPLTNFLTMRTNYFFFYKCINENNKRE